MKIPFITNYFSGKAYETWCKLAIGVSHKKLIKGLENEKLALAVLRYIYAVENEGNNYIFVEMNQDLIKKRL